jgi:hypothetical protein
MQYQRQSVIANILTLIKLSCVELLLIHVSIILCQMQEACGVEFVRLFWFDFTNTVGLEFQKVYFEFPLADCDQCFDCHSR